MTNQLYAISFLVFFLAIIARPAVAFAAVLLMFLFEQWGMGGSAWVVAHQSLTNTLVGVLVLEAIVVMAFRGQLVFSYFPRIGWLIIALFGWTSLTLFWSIYAGSIFLWKTHIPYVLTIIFLSPFVINTIRDLNVALLTTLVFGAILLLLCMVTREWATRGIVLQGTIYAAGKSVTVGTPLSVATGAGYIGLIAILYHFRKATRPLQALRWVIVALALAVIIRTGSRGQLLSFLGTAIVMLPISRQIQSFKGFAAVGLGSFLLVMMTLWAFSHFASEGRWIGEDAIGDFQNARLGPALILLDTWVNYGVVRWAVGLGNSASFDPQLLGVYPHMVIAEVLAEEGVIGFTLFVAIIGQGALLVRRMYTKVCHDPIARGTLAAGAAIVLFDLILSAKQGSLLTFQVFFAFLIVFGRIERQQLAQIIPRQPLLAQTNT